MIINYKQRGRDDLVRLWRREVTLFNEARIPWLQPWEVQKTMVAVSPTEKRVSFSLEELENLPFNKENPYSRDYEIQKWIEYFHPKHYVILDDFSFHLENLKEHLFQTKNLALHEHDMALRLHHVSEIKKILNKDV